MNRNNTKNSYCNYKPTRTILHIIRWVEHARLLLYCCYKKLFPCCFRPPFMTGHHLSVSATTTNLSILIKTYANSLLDQRKPLIDFLCKFKPFLQLHDNHWKLCNREPVKLSKCLAMYIILTTGYENCFIILNSDKW